MASANIDEDRVMKKPISFAIAMPRLAKNAAMIALVLPPAMATDCVRLDGRTARSSRFL
jgi:hypothetical protein